MVLILLDQLLKVQKGVKNIVFQKVLDDVLVVAHILTNLVKDNKTLGWLELVIKTAFGAVNFLMWRQVDPELDPIVDEDSFWRVGLKSSHQPLDTVNEVASLSYEALFVNLSSLHLCWT